MNGDTYEPANLIKKISINTVILVNVELTQTNKLTKNSAEELQKILNNNQ